MKVIELLTEVETYLDDNGCFGNYRFDIYLIRISRKFSYIEAVKNKEIISIIDNRDNTVVFNFMKNDYDQEISEINYFNDSKCKEMMRLEKYYSKLIRNVKITEFLKQ